MGETVAITTYNRADRWRSGGLWASLLAQTARPDEVVIVDDNSTDDTRDVLCRLRDTSPIPVRLYRCLLDKQQVYQANAAPENLAIHYARGDVYVHLDDDGWVDPGLIEFVRAREMPAAWYGHCRFYLNNGEKFVANDWRKLKYEAEYGPTHRISKASQHRFGPIWCCPRSTLCELGGHDMTLAQYRGSDVRLGARVGQRLECWFTSEPAFTFHHYGWSWSQRQAALGRNLALYRRLPRGDAVVANYGLAFWDQIGDVIPHEEM